MSKSKTKIKRPFWQTRPCPDWCQGYHSDGDAPEVRQHELEDEPSVALSLPKAVPFHNSQSTTPVTLRVGIQQGHREVEPRVTVYQGLGTPEERVDLEFTVEEAERFVRCLTKIIRRAKGGAR